MTTPNPLSAFSHIYIERDVLTHLRTQQVLAAFPKAQVIEIESLRELTTTKGTVWSYQKQHPKLILALKSSELIYPCSDVAPNFGHQHFYYAVPMQNCIYDCEYCYLQGMYPSAHLVLFVNQDSMHEAVRIKASQLDDLYLCIAYDNDILALESKFGLVGEWVEALRDVTNLTMEVRTKSANFGALKALQPPKNVILAWTMSPPSIVTRFEAKTPPLKARLHSALQAIALGWRVRICLDPLLPFDDWINSYKELFAILDESNIWPHLEDSCYGTFRMNSDYLRRARKARPESALLHSATARDARGLHILPSPQLPELISYVGNNLTSRMGRDRVVLT